MTNNLKQKMSRAGFTLLEFIIYIAIVGGLSTFVAGAFIIANRGGSVAQARYAVNSNMRVVLDSIEQDIKNASDVLTPVVTANSSTLLVRIGPDTITYDVLSGRLRRNGQNITSESVTVSGANFRLFTNLNIPTLKHAININSTITIAYNSSSPESAFSETLSKTALFEPLASWPPRGSFGVHTNPPGPGNNCQVNVSVACNSIPCLNSLPSSKHYANPFNFIKRLYAAVIDPCDDTQELATPTQ